MSDSHRLKPYGGPSSAVNRANSGVAFAFYQSLPPLESSVPPIPDSTSKSGGGGRKDSLPDVCTFSSDAGPPRIATTSLGHGAMGCECVPHSHPCDPGEGTT